jgi:hypothetical protein
MTSSLLAFTKSVNAHGVRARKTNPRRVLTAGCSHPRVSVSAEALTDVLRIMLLDPGARLLEREEIWQEACSGLKWK